GTGKVQAIRGQRGEVFLVIKIPIEDSSIVLPRGYEECWLAAEEKVMRVVGVECERLGAGSGGSKCNQDQNAGIRLSVHSFVGSMKSPAWLIRRVWLPPD